MCKDRGRDLIRLRGRPLHRVSESRDAAWQKLLVWQEIFPPCIYDAMDSSAEDNDITLLRQSKKFLKDLGEAFESIENVSNEQELEAIIRKVQRQPPRTQARY